MLNRWLALASAFVFLFPCSAQLVDQTQTPNLANEGILKSLQQQIGAGRADAQTPGSSLYLIARDPFRSIRRGRQLFQRKFTREQGQGPLSGDGAGDIANNLAIGAGLADSCAACHGRPRGAAGFGGDVATRPDSRDSPHLFGLGLKEMLADEMTQELRAQRDAAIAQAAQGSGDARRNLVAKGVRFGSIRAFANGNVDTSQVEGLDADLRVRPFFAHGGTISIREFVVGALNAEMGLQTADPDLLAVAAGQTVVTPAGMTLDPADNIETSPAASPSDDPDNDGVVNEIDPALIDHFEFYLLNYFKPATDRQTHLTRDGQEKMRRIGCTQCHVAELRIDHDRRVADVETVHDPRQGIFNNLFATAEPLFVEIDDGGGDTLKQPGGGPFVVRNIYTDFKRHDLGPEFYEIEYGGTMRKEFLTTALWGVGSTSPYGHDGRSTTLRNVILRHGGEAQRSRDEFQRLRPEQQHSILAFLRSLTLFPPDDTASNLNPGDHNTPNFPQFGHGNINLGVLFNDPSDPE
jgi:hypothetical protein